MANLYDLSVQTIDGKEQTLAHYKGKVLLIVNVASACGLTPQYEGLEALYRAYKDKGFEVLGFPCNQFGAQEPGTSADIKLFCSTRFDVSFPLFAKIEVNGPGAHPLYQWLKSQKAGADGKSEIEWNFAKFIVDREGKLVDRIHPRIEPQALRPTLDSLLA